MEGDAVLRVYVSLSGSPDGRDAADGARLALADAGRLVDPTVEAEYLEAPTTPAEVGANARAATQDSTAIAYLGDFDSGATRTSLPITNAAGMLQVSPASAATDLVVAFPGSDEISELQATGRRTFGRVIPGDEAQARAAAGWVDELGIRTVSISGDNSDVRQGRRRQRSATPSNARPISDAGELDFYAGSRSPERRRPGDGHRRAAHPGVDPQSRGTGTLATSAALDPLAAAAGCRRVSRPLHRRVRPRAGPLRRLRLRGDGADSRLDRPRRRPNRPHRPWSRRSSKRPTANRSSAPTRSTRTGRPPSSKVTGYEIRDGLRGAGRVRSARTRAGRAAPTRPR